jgi:hypothetical protein
VSQQLVPTQLLELRFTRARGVDVQRCLRAAGCTRPPNTLPVSTSGAEARGWVGGWRSLLGSAHSHWATALALSRLTQIHPPERVAQRLDG